MDKTIEIPFVLYNTFMNRVMKFDLLKKVVAESIKTYSTSNSLFVDNNLVDYFRLLCPYEYEKRMEQIEKDRNPEEGDAE